MGRVNRLAVQTAMWWMCGTLQRGEEPPASCKEDDPSPVQGPALSSEVKFKKKKKHKSDVCRGEIHGRMVGEWASHN